MEDGDTVNNDNMNPEKVSTVAGQVLEKFFEELAKESDLAQVAANLKNLILNDGVFAEPAIREALFSDAP